MTTSMAESTAAEREARDGEGGGGEDSTAILTVAVETRAVVAK